MARNNEEIDEVRTFTLSHRRQKHDVEPFVQALIGNHEVHLEYKDDIFTVNSRSREANTAELLDHVRNMTGVILLCSEDLVALLDNPTSQETNVDIQLSGDDVPLDAEILRLGIEDSEQIRRKIMVVKMPEDDDSVPTCLARNEPVKLSEDDLVNHSPRLTANDIWVSEKIVPNLRCITQVIRRSSQS